jgi:hypothetical protein
VLLASVEGWAGVRVTEMLTAALRWDISISMQNASTVFFKVEIKVRSLRLPIKKNMYTVLKEVLRRLRVLRRNFHHFCFSNSVFRFFVLLS